MNGLQAHTEWLDHRLIDDPLIVTSHDKAMTALLERLSSSLVIDCGLIMLSKPRRCVEVARLVAIDTPHRMPTWNAERCVGAEVEAHDSVVLVNVRGQIHLACCHDLGGGAHLHIRLARSRQKPAVAVAEQRKFRALIPWISDYIKLWWSSKFVTTYAERMDEAFNRVALNLILTAADCCVVSINPAASMLLGVDKTLSIGKGRLSASNLNDDIRLKTIIFYAADDPYVEGHSSTKVLRLQRCGQRPLILAVSACGRSGDMGATAEGSSVLVQIVDPAIDLAQHVDVACAVHGITGSEARLAKMLVTGHSLLEAAAQLRVQPDTARTYLKQIFMRTGVNRQSALIALLLTSMVREVPGNKLSFV